MFIASLPQKIKTTTVFILVLLTQAASYGQNLVPNPSFENVIQCPSSFGLEAYTSDWTNGTTRLLVNNGTNANNAGRIAMGNNLPVGFIPRDRLHLHQQNGGRTMLRFTNGNTGATNADGFRIGIGDNGFVQMRHMENDSIVMRSANGRLVMYGNNNAFTIPNGLVKIGESNGGAGNTEGYIAMSNSLPVGFQPQDRLHLS
ncbi:MAG: hypothetical protein JKY53_12490 [Flavobacteriales bacterium]|nr:hypothetical protein [Flavobacteriales bacterium]